MDKFFVVDLMRAKDVRWCYLGFVQADRAFDCTREKGHEGRCDSQLAQEFRQEFQQSEGVR